MKTEEIKLKFLKSGVGYFEAKIEKDERILAILIIYSTHKRNTWHLKIYPHYFISPTFYTETYRGTEKGAKKEAVKSLQKKVAGDYLGITTIMEALDENGK
jgi:hypothetical protein